MYTFACCFYTLQTDYKVWCHIFQMAASYLAERREVDRVHMEEKMKQKKIDEQEREEIKRQQNAENLAANSKAWEAFISTTKLKDISLSEVMHHIDDNLVYDTTIRIEVPNWSPEKDFILTLPEGRKFTVRSNLWSDGQDITVCVYPQKHSVDLKELLEKAVEKPLEKTLDGSENNELSQFIVETLLQNNVCIAKGMWSDGTLLLRGFKKSSLLMKLKKEFQEIADQF